MITAIVEAMPSNVHLHTGTLVSDIRYAEGMYASMWSIRNNACGQSIRENSNDSSSTEVLVDKAPADHVIIITHRQRIHNGLR